MSFGGGRRKEPKPLDQRIVERRVTHHEGVGRRVLIDSAPSEPSTRRAKKKSRTPTHSSTAAVSQYLNSRGRSVGTPAGLPLPSADKSQLRRQNGDVECRAFRRFRNGTGPKFPTVFVEDLSRNTP